MFVYPWQSGLDTNLSDSGANWADVWMTLVWFTYVVKLYSVTCNIKCFVHAQILALYVGDVC